MKLKIWSKLLLWLGCLVTLLMGNVTFVLLDRLLKLRFRIRK